MLVVAGATDFLWPQVEASTVSVYFKSLSGSDIAIDDRLVGCGKSCGLALTCPIKADANTV